MRINSDMPDVVVHDGEDLFLLPIHASRDLKAMLVVVVCLAAIAGAAALFVRLIGL